MELLLQLTSGLRRCQRALVADGRRAHCAVEQRGPPLRQHVTRLSRSSNLINSLEN
jgi:hypothetical protein